MTKLEELKEALTLADAGEWYLSRHATPEYAPQFGIYIHESQTDLAIVRGEGNAQFIVLAHELAPVLLEAVVRLQGMVDVFNCKPSKIDPLEAFVMIEQSRHTLEKLK